MGLNNLGNWLKSKKIIIATTLLLSACGWGNSWTKEPVNKIPVVTTPVNKAPIANTDPLTTAYNTPILIDVLENDTDPEWNNITLTGEITDQTWGTFIVQDNKILFTPNIWARWEASAIYENTDGLLNSTAKINVTIEEPEMDTVTVQLGWNVANSYVVITTKNQEEITSGTTDENGVLTMIMPDVLAKLKEFWATENDDLLITATGWLDNNRDVNGMLSAYASINQIRWGFVNSVSTILDKMTQNHTIELNSVTYSDTVIKFLEQNNFIDVNKDGKIDYLDALIYDVNNQESELETSLRIKFMEAIYTGIDIEAAIIEYQKETNLISEEVNTDNIIQELKLSKNNPDTIIKYYLWSESESVQNKSTANTTSWNSYFEWETIYVDPATVVYYKENYGDYTGTTQEYINSNNAPLNLGEINCDQWLEIFEWVNQSCFMEASDTNGITWYTAQLDGGELDITEDNWKYSVDLEDLEIWEYILTFSFTSNTYDGEPEAGEKTVTISVVEDVEWNALIARTTTLENLPIELIDWATEVDVALITAYEAAKKLLEWANNAVDIASAIIVYNEALAALNAAIDAANELASSELTTALALKVTALEQNITLLIWAALEPTAEILAYTEAIAALNLATTVATINPAITVLNNAVIALNTSIDAANEAVNIAPTLNLVITLSKTKGEWGTVHSDTEYTQQTDESIIIDATSSIDSDGSITNMTVSSSLISGELYNGVLTSYTRPWIWNAYRWQDEIITITITDDDGATQVKILTVHWE